jgi:hypothetical protein
MKAFAKQLAASAAYVTAAPLAIAAVTVGPRIAQGITDSITIALWPLFH